MQIPVSLSNRLSFSFNRLSGRIDTGGVLVVRFSSQFFSVACQVHDQGTVFLLYVVNPYQLVASVTMKELLSSK